jgi:hypothetical protein
MRSRLRVDVRKERLAEQRHDREQSGDVMARSRMET